MEEKNPTKTTFGKFFGSLKTIRYLIKHMNMLFWGVSLGPYYLTWIFTSKMVLPMEEAPSSIWDVFSLVFNWSWLSRTMSDSPELFLGFLIIGPLLGASTILFNDYFDREPDRSIRKNKYPLAKGLLKPGTVLWTSILFMVLAILLSLKVSSLFAGLVSICVFLSIIYSAPPVRLKNRAGLDLLTCIFGAGIICSFAGWVAAETAGYIRPLGEIFWWFFIIAFGTASIYMLTVVVDHDGDKKEGINTIAVRLGIKNAFYLGFLFIALADLIIAVISYNNILFSRGFFNYAMPVIAIQLIPFYLLTRKPTSKNGTIAIVQMGTMLVVGNTLMVLDVTGLL